MHARHSSLVAMSTKGMDLTSKLEKFPDFAERHINAKGRLSEMQTKA